MSNKAGDRKTGSTRTDSAKTTRFLAEFLQSAGVFLLSLWLKSLRCRTLNNGETGIGTELGGGSAFRSGCNPDSSSASEFDWDNSDDLNGSQDLDGLQNAAEIPILYTLWHQDLPAAMAVAKDRNIHVMISASSDGSLAAGCARSLGYQVVAGSGSRQPQALRHLLRALKSGESAGMALDGPRGPRGAVFPGSAWLYEHCHCQAMHMQIEYGCALKINSWDRTRIPLPFSRVTLQLTPWNPQMETVPGRKPE